MNNAKRFKKTFGIYATEMWAMPEADFLEWLNDSEANYDIEDAPTVDAIPIDWIKTNYAWLIAEGKNDVVDVLTEMIEEWRSMSERKEK